MEDGPDGALLELIIGAINHAIECVSGGATLSPFILTNPPPDAEEQGEIIMLVAERGQEIREMAQERLPYLQTKGVSFVFVFEASIIVEGVPSDAIFVEAKSHDEDKIFVFAQRFQTKKFLRPFKRIGNVVFLNDQKPQLTLSNPS